MLWLVSDSIYYRKDKGYRPEKRRQRQSGFHKRLEGARQEGRYYLSYEKDDVFLTRFAQDIRKDREEGIVGEPTLLNYNCLDCGLYTVADIYPSCYWFQTQTLPTDVIRDEQERYTKEELIDYIVVYEWYPGSFEEHYDRIDTFEQVMGDEKNTYYLLRRRSAGRSQEN